MLYASELFRQLDRGKIAVEENPDDIPDLVAEHWHIGGTQANAQPEFWLSTRRKSRSPAGPHRSSGHRKTPTAGTRDGCLPFEDLPVNTPVIDMSEPRLTQWQASFTGQISAIAVARLPASLKG